MTESQQLGNIVEQFGSLERYKKVMFMRNIGAKGGKNSTSRPFRDPMLASKAGKARMANMTPEQRSELSKRASDAKRAKKLASVKVEIESEG